MIKRFAPTLTALLALGLSGCQAPAAPQATEPAPRLLSETGTITVDLASLASAWRKRRVLAEGDCGHQEPSFNVTQIVLRVLGPGLTTPPQAAIPWSETCDGQEPALAFSLAVPAGLNRVFVIEALNAQGKVLHRLHSAGTVVAGAALTVTTNFSMDAVGRTLVDLLGPVPAGQTDTAGIKNLLGSEDFVKPIGAYVDRATGYTAATNTYSVYSPGHFRSRRLAKELRAVGKAVLDPAAAVLADHTKSGLASFQLTVDAYAANYPYPLAISVFTPFGDGLMTYPGDSSTTDFGDPVATATIADLAPGDWAYLVRAGSRQAWGQISIGEFPTDVASAAITLPVGPALPTADFDIYAGSLSADWDVALASEAGATAPVRNLADTTPISGGTTPQIAFQPMAEGGSLLIKNIANIQDFGLYGDGLSFNVSCDLSNEPFSIQLHDGTRPIGQAVPLQPGYGYYTAQTLPWMSFGFYDTFRARAIKITYHGNGTPTLYLDDLRLDYRPLGL